MRGFFDVLVDVEACAVWFSLLASRGRFLWDELLVVFILGELADAVRIA